MKCVSSGPGLTDEVIAYAQWTLPITLWERVRDENGGGIQAEVTEAMREGFERDHAESCTPDGEPRGMRMEVVEFCAPAMREAGKRCFPQNEDYISTSPACSLHLRSYALSYALLT